VEALIKPPQRSITIGEIARKVEEVLSKEVSEARVRKFIKKDLKYSYKKGSSRPSKIRKPPHVYSKVLF
jgi:hypothetical protein